MTSKKILAIVAVEPVPPAFHALWAAKDPQPTQIDAGIVQVRVLQHRLDVEDHVVGNVEIEVAVSIVVEKRRARAEVIAGNPSLRCDRGKGAIPAIAIERIGPVVGHIQIALSVAVVIPHSHPHAPAAIFDASYNRHKSSTIVAAKHITRPHTIVGIGRAVHHVEIEIAVAVVVEKRRAAAGRFEDEALVGVAVYGGLL